MLNIIQLEEMHLCYKGNIKELYMISLPLSDLMINVLHIMVVEEIVYYS